MRTNTTDEILFLKSCNHILRIPFHLISGDQRDCFEKQKQKQKPSFYVLFRSISFLLLTLFYSMLSFLQITTEGS